MTAYTPLDWYWDNGTDVFSSARQARVPYSDPAYIAWTEAGNAATRDPATWTCVTCCRRTALGSVRPRRPSCR